MPPDKHIYLDYAATTPTNSQVVEAMLEYHQNTYGNPSSLHSSGRQAKHALDQARAVFATGLHADPNEIVFTGGGSEADNLALIGVALANQQLGKHIITSSIEHHAILHSCEFLETLGFTIDYLPVDQYGVLSPDQLADSIRPNTILVSIMHANNEIGTIQPIAELAKIAHAHGALFHTDAVQTVGQLAVDIQTLNVDLLTLSAHKFYGPKGVGALFVKDGIQLESLVHGGGQEKNRRAGTENVPGIVGAAKAFELAIENLENEAARLSHLRNELWQRLSRELSEIHLNGHPGERLPNNLNVCFKNVEAEGLLLRLNIQGIEASMGSACNSESIEPSYVIKALGLPPEWARGALRLTLGCNTTMDDIVYTADVIIDIVKEIQTSSEQG